MDKKPQVYYVSSVPSTPYDLPRHSILPQGAEVVLEKVPGCQDATEAPTHSTPKSWQLPWGTSPCRHGSSSPPHYQTFRSSVQGCRGRRRVVLGGSSRLHLCKQPLLLESSLIPTPGSKWLKLIQVEPSALGQHSQQHPNHWRPLGCGLGKLNPGGQTKVSWKSRTERLFHHPLSFEERAHLSLPLEPTVSCHRCHFCSSPTNKKPNQTLWWTQQP